MARLRQIPLTRRLSWFIFCLLITFPSVALAAVTLEEDVTHFPTLGAGANRASIKLVSTPAKLSFLCSMRDKLCRHRFRGEPEDNIDSDDDATYIVTEVRVYEYSRWTRGKYLFRMEVIPRGHGKQVAVNAHKYTLIDLAPHWPENSTDLVGKRVRYGYVIQKEVNEDGDLGEAQMLFDSSGKKTHVIREVPGRVQNSLPMTRDNLRAPHRQLSRSRTNHDLAEFISKSAVDLDEVPYEDISDEDACNICLANLKEERLAEPRAPIALEDFDFGFDQEREEGVREKVVKMTSCNHRYHAKCVQEWLQMKAICPMCRIDEVKAVKPRGNSWWY